MSVSIDLRHVRAIAEIKKHKSFRRAASALNVTPPAISKLIKELEADLGVEVVDRNDKTLTPYGEAILQQGKEAIGSLSKTSEIIDELKSITNSQCVIACSVFLAPDIAARAVSLMINDSPTTHFKIDSLEPEDALEKFNNGSCDVLILDGEEEKNITCPYEIKIFDHPEILYWVRKNHPLAGKPVSLQECLSYPLIGPRAPKWWQVWFREFLTGSDIPLPSGYDQTSQYHILVANDWNCLEVLQHEQDAISGGLGQWLKQEGGELFSEIHVKELPPFPKDIKIFVANRPNKSEVVEQFVDAATLAIAEHKPSPR